MSEIAGQSHLITFIKKSMSGLEQTHVGVWGGGVVNYAHTRSICMKVDGNKNHSNVHTKSVRHTCNFSFILRAVKDAKERS